MGLCLSLAEVACLFASSKLIARVHKNPLTTLEYRLTLFRVCLVQNVHRLELRRPSLLWLPFEIQDLIFWYAFCDPDS